jgi:hypothetical protein
MIRTAENPYHSPTPQDVKGCRKANAAFSSRAIRFATLGILAGVGFGFVILAMTARSSLEPRSLDASYFTIDYATPLFAFAFWTITTGAFFGVVGAAIGFVADLVRPVDNAKIDEPSDARKSPVSRDFES